MVIPEVVQINISAGGVPKLPIDEGHVTFDRVVGDDWRYKNIHGGRDQAVLIIAEEVINDLRVRGYPVFNGALGENLTTRGLDYRSMQYGDRLRVGHNVLLEVTKRRAPCRTITVYGADIGREIFDQDAHQHETISEKWGRAGFYCKVINEGRIKPGDRIEWYREKVQFS